MTSFQDRTVYGGEEPGLIIGAGKGERSVRKSSTFPTARPRAGNAPKRPRNPRRGEQNPRRGERNPGAAGHRSSPFFSRIKTSVNDGSHADSCPAAARRAAGRGTSTAPAAETHAARTKVAGSKVGKASVPCGDPISSSPAVPRTPSPYPPAPAAAARRDAPAAQRQINGR